MKKSYYVGLILFIIILPSILNAETNTLVDYNISKNNINQLSMTILGSWAIVNFAGFGSASFFTTGSIKSFFQINALWNIVNIVIAFPALYQSLTFDSSKYDLEKTISSHFDLEKVFLLNTGLDVAYIMTGFLLMEIGKRTKNQEQMNGFGWSLILQGGFLMIFDLVLFFIHNNHYNDLKKLL